MVEADRRFSNFTVYVDESGDHSLEGRNAEYPLFVLAFCLAGKSDYRARITPEITSFKHRWFGHEAVIIHAHEIRKEKGDFKFMFDRKVRERFLEDLTVLMDQMPYIVIGSIIDKTLLTSQYANPDNPYSIALKFCLERAFLYLRAQGEANKLTHVVVESRGRKEDSDLEVVFRHICNGANAFSQPLPFEVVVVDKKQNLPGLQLADLVCHPIGRHFLKPGQTNRAYEVIEKKIRRDASGGLAEYGLKIFP